MSVVRLGQDAVDALEHAMQGVQTHDPHHVECAGWDPGLIGQRSASRVAIVDDTLVEHEVTVVLRRAPRRQRRRRRR